MIDFLEKNDVCPTCEQDIDEHSKQTISQRSEQVKELSEGLIQMKKEMDNNQQTQRVQRYRKGTQR